VTGDNEPGGRPCAGADDGGTGADRMHDDWPEDDDPDLDAEHGLPLSAENWATGEPLVTVDYFGFAPGAGARIAWRLFRLRGAEPDRGAEGPRIFLFDPRLPLDAPFDDALIAIATVREDDLRVETAQRALTDRIRTRIEAVLRGEIRHLRRCTENPVEECLHR